MKIKRMENNLNQLQSEFVNQSAAWGFLSVPMALFICVLELLVAFLQAYLFAMLSALFIGAAVEEAHH